MLRTRIISAVIGIPVLLGILYAGGIFWWVFFILLGIIGLFEFYRMMNNKGLTPISIPGYLLLIIFLLSGQIDAFSLLAALFILFFTIVFYAVLSYPRVTIDDIAVSFFAPVYLGFLLSYAIAIGNFDNSFIIMLIALVLTWSSDIGGYAFGKVWGKHKMVPVLSPKKSWEGAIGGIVFSIITAITVSLFVTTEVNLIYGILLGIIASILAQFGDLFISGVKRYFGVKDTGNIIPGHGGVLDRFDSFLLVVPLVYYFFYFIN